MRQRLDDELLPFNVVGDMEALPFPDGAFDAALALACLHHIPHPRAGAGRGVPRAPSGRAAVLARPELAAGAHATGRCRSRASTHEFRVSVRWLAEQMRRAGFEIEEIRGRGLTMRAVAKVVREPSLRLYHAGDAVDRVLRVVPGLESLSEQGMIRARKPA